MSEFVAYLIDPSGSLESLVTPLVVKLGGRLVICEPGQALVVEDRDHASCVIVRVEEPSPGISPTFQIDALIPYEGLLDSLPKIVVMPVANTEHAIEWMRAGASAVVDLSTDLEHWSRNISEVVQADREELRENEMLLRTFRKYYNLTPRQRQIVGHLLDGRQNKWIAATLDVSKRTVELDRASILQSMDVENSIQLAAAITEMRLIKQIRPRLMFQVRNHRVDDADGDPPGPRQSSQTSVPKKSSASPSA